MLTEALFITLIRLTLLKLIIVHLVVDSTDAPLITLVSKSGCQVAMMKSIIPLRQFFVTLTYSVTVVGHLVDDLLVVAGEQVADVLQPDVARVRDQTDRVQHAVDVAAEAMILRHFALHGHRDVRLRDARHLDAVLVQDRHNLAHVLRDLVFGGRRQPRTARCPEQANNGENCENGKVVLHDGEGIVG